MSTLEENVKVTVEGAEIVLERLPRILESALTDAIAQHGLYVTALGAAEVGDQLEVSQALYDVLHANEAHIEALRVVCKKAWAAAIPAGSSAEKNWDAAYGASSPSKGAL